MPPFITVFWILKNRKAIPNITVEIVSDADRLRAQLAPAAPAVEDAGDAVRGVGVRRAVPAVAVLAVGEDARRPARRRRRTRRAPRSRRPGRRLPRFSMNHTDSTTITPAMSADDRRRPRLHERARRRDRDEAGEHAVGHHPGVGLARCGPSPRTSRRRHRTRRRSRCSPRRRRTGCRSPRASTRR